MLKRFLSFMKFLFCFALFTSLLISCASQTKTSQKEVNLSILYLNDTHGKIEEEKNKDGVIVAGGAVRWDGAINSVRNTDKNVLVLHAGDWLTGSSYSTFFKGRAEIEIANLIGFDASAVGNHEFDYKLNNALELKKLAKFPFVSANVYDANKKNIFTPYIITNIDGQKIVIIGLTVSDKGMYAKDAIEGVIFEDEMITLSNLIYSKKIVKDSDFVILLSHTGIEKDVVFANNFPLIDIIVGGHSHTKLNQGTNVNGVYIVQNGEWGKTLGYAYLKINSGRIVSFEDKSITLDDKVEIRDKVKDYIAKLKEEQKATLGVKIAVSEFALDATKDVIRSNPSQIGNMTADFIKNGSGAEIGIVNAGAIRASLPAGDITLGHIYAYFAFDNKIATIKLKGSTLKAIALRGIKSKGTGGFLCWSKGVKIKVNQDGTINMTFNNEPIDDNRYYLVATGDFTMEGGDGFVEFKEGIEKNISSVLIRDSIIEQLKKYGKIDSTIADPVARIEF